MDGADLIVEAVARSVKLSRILIAIQRFLWWLLCDWHLKSDMNLAGGDFTMAGGIADTV